LNRFKSLQVALNRFKSILSVSAGLKRGRVDRPTMPSSQCWTLGMIAIPTDSFKFQMPTSTIPDGSYLDRRVFMANCVLTSDPQTRRIVIGFDRAHCAADDSGVRLHTLIRDYQSQRLDASLASGVRAKPWSVGSQSTRLWHLRLLLALGFTATCWQRIQMQVPSPGNHL
jgi:hypothetical protein